MSEYLDALWEKYYDHEKKISLLDEMMKAEAFAKSLDIPDNSIANRISEYCFEILSQNKSKEKEAFLEGVRQGNRLQL